MNGFSHRVFGSVRVYVSDPVTRLTRKKVTQLTRLTRRPGDPIQLWPRPTSPTPKTSPTLTRCLECVT